MDMKKLFLRALIFLRIARPSQKKQLFFVLKFGGKIYLKMTEYELRAEIATTNGVGVQFKDKSLVFQCYEIDPSGSPKEKAGGV
jgi:hypothetical protein